MKKTIEEQVKARLQKAGRRSKIHKIAVGPVLGICMLYFKTVSYIRGNGKRFAMLAMPFLLFAVYSSFSFPAFISEVGNNNSMEEIYASQDVALAEETTVAPADPKLLEEEALLERELYEGTSHGMDITDTYEADEILKYTEDYVPTLPEEPQEPLAQEGGEPVFSAEDWRLLLVNKQHSIPEDYTFTLGTISGSLQCDERILEDLRSMLQAAKEDGIRLLVCSPYRDMERQILLFERKINSNMNRGMSYIEAYQMGSQWVMVPGASEHQLGLSLDIVCNSYQTLDSGFANTDAGQWLVDNCWRFGFILRYPEGKEYITGVSYEPWHFRYVGGEAAKIIMEEGITLEEFWEEYLN